jgi:uncharacterized coiled-coil protein SlyX
MKEEKEFKITKLINSNIDWTNVDEVFDLIEQIMTTDEPEADNPKRLKLYAIGEILTKNKNELVAAQKKEITALTQKIFNQRKHINKLEKRLVLLQSQVNFNNKQKKITSDNIDSIAYKKATAAYDNQFNNPYPKKKVIVKRKIHN